MDELIKLLQDYDAATAIILYFLAHRLGLLDLIPKLGLKNGKKNGTTKVIGDNPHVSIGTCKVIHKNIDEKLERIGDIHSKHGLRLKQIEDDIGEIRLETRGFGEMKSKIDNLHNFNQSIYYFLKNKYPDDIDDITRV